MRFNVIDSQRGVVTAPRKPFKCIRATSSEIVRKGDAYCNESRVASNPILE